MLKESHAFSSFSVKDIEVAKKFYNDVLGLSTTEKPEGLELVAGNNQVFVYPKEDHQPAVFTVLNFVVEDIDKTVDELVAQGVQLERYPEMQPDEKGVSRNDGQYPGPAAIAWLKDPSGNIFSVIQQ